MELTSSSLSEKLTLNTRAQKTLKREVSFSGIGIHTGHLVNLTFCPAEKGTGVVFRREDLPSKPMIPATVEYVQDTSRNTTIGIGNARVHTVEHVLAALYAYEIDNVLIKVDGPEPPVGNGSSDVFIDMIESVGFEEQPASKAILGLKEPIYFSQGSIHIVGIPSDEYKISYTLHYPQVPTIGSQYHSLTITPENFKNEISECRTFALYKELKMLMDAGLIKGGSLDNAVVVHEEAVFSKEGLKFPNEMVRHKILDVVGDLSLVGFALKAHIISICSGHATNVAFAKKLLTHITMENN
jgi:UDP-3-O-[3-hydroxymyristoyl] N-acetylglucosamine deacetylase